MSTILVLIPIVMLILLVCFFLFSVMIEQNLKDNHPIKKWWRKHIVAPYKEDE